VVVNVRSGFRALVVKRPLCEGTTTPFLTAARVLLAKGADPDAALVMRRPGTDHDALQDGDGTGPPWRYGEF
jgi:hypothetical protein